MLFTSFGYLFLFLPIMLAGYLFIAKRNHQLAIWWLGLGSFFFYAFWNPKYLPILLCSIAVNYTIGRWIENSSNGRLGRLAIGLAFNIGLLGYFKYTNFFVDNFNLLFGTNFFVEPIALPLAISFFTFQQIVWIVDKYRGSAVQGNIRDYIGAVTFFPHLIAGPIVQYKHLLPQFADRTKAFLNWENMARGLFLISLGAFKKLIIADTLSIYVGNGFDSGNELSLLYAWMAVLAYTFQIYFDFSGYCDIAIGSAWFFNIHLPNNFNSPYRAKSVREFWQRWHMTLGYFLTNYLYIPLGGNRKGIVRTCVNIMLVMFLSGLWHGAAYGFVLWGSAHGFMMVLQRLFSSFKINIPRIPAMIGTFTFVVLAWVLFRAKDLSTAGSIYKGLFGLNGIELSEKLKNYIPDDWGVVFVKSSQNFLFENGSFGELGIFLGLAFLIVLAGREAIDIWNQIICKKSLYGYVAGAIAGFLLVLALIRSVIVPYSEFIYFNF